MRKQNGFTFIELLLVISIIGILAAVAIPNFIRYQDRAFLCEGYELVDPIRKDIIDFYDHRGFFPASNAVLGYPEVIKGKYVESIAVQDGAIVITYNEDARSFGGTVITLRPGIDDNDPPVGVTWESEEVLPK